MAGAAAKPKKSGPCPGCGKYQVAYLEGRLGWFKVKGTKPAPATPATPAKPAPGSKSFWDDEVSGDESEPDGDDESDE